MILFVIKLYAWTDIFNVTILLWWGWIKQWTFAEWLLNILMFWYFANSGIRMTGKYKWIQPWIKYLRTLLRFIIASAHQKVNKTKRLWIFEKVKVWVRKNFRILENKGSSTNHRCIWIKIKINKTFDFYSKKLLKHSSKGFQRQTYLT